jgi:nucleoid-associated protein YgaU
MSEEKKGLFDGLINAVTGRDEKAAAEAAKKEAEEALARAEQEAALRREAEAKAAVAEAIAKADAENKAAEAAAKVRADAAAEVDQLKQELEAERAARREQVQAKAQTYVVKSGDSLSKIAKELWGDAKRWPEIFEANKDKIKDPNLIHPGQELRIP